MIQSHMTSLEVLSGPCISSVQMMTARGHSHQHTHARCWLLTVARAGGTGSDCSRQHAHYFLTRSRRARTALRWVWRTGEGCAHADRFVHFFVRRTGREGWNEEKNARAFSERSKSRVRKMNPGNGQTGMDWLGWVVGLMHGLLYDTKINTSL